MYSSPLPLMVKKTIEESLDQLCLNNVKSDLEYLSGISSERVSAVESIRKCIFKTLMPDEQKVLEALSLSPQYESEASDISHEHKYRKVLKWLPVIQFLDELLITKDLDLDADQEITISAAHTAVQNRLQFLKVSRTPFRQRNPRLPLPRSLDRLKPVSAPVPTALPNPSPLRPEGTLSTSLQRFPSHRGLSFPERLDRWADLTKKVLSVPDVLSVSQCIYNFAVTLASDFKTLSPRDRKVHDELMSQLVDLFYASLDVACPAALSHGVYGMGIIGKRMHFSVAKKVVSLFLSYEGTLTPQQLSMVIFGFGEMRISAFHNEASSLVERFLELPQTPRPDDIANVLSGLGNLSLSAVQMVEELSEAMIDVVADASPQSLLRAMSCLSHYSYADADQQMTILVEEILSRKSDVSADDLCSVLFYLRIFGKECLKLLLQRTLDIVSKRLGDLSTQSLCIALQTQRYLHGHNSRQVINKLLHEFVLKIHLASASQISMVLFELSKMNASYFPNMINKLTDAIIDRIQTAEPRDLARSMKALAFLGSTDSLNAIRLLSSQLFLRVESLSTNVLVSAIFSLAMYDVEPYQAKGFLSECKRRCDAGSQDFKENQLMYLHHSSMRFEVTDLIEYWKEKYEKCKKNHRAPLQMTSGEIQLKDMVHQFLSDKNIPVTEVIENYIINGLECDLYVVLADGRRIDIEFDGLKYHSPLKDAYREKVLRGLGIDEIIRVTCVEMNEYRKSMSPADKESFRNSRFSSLMVS